MKKILFFLLAITIVSCKNSEKKADETTTPEVKIYQLVGGSILVKKLEVFSQDTTYTGQSKQFTDAYYVISHPKGNLMWDAGLPEQLVMPEPYDEPSGVYRIQRPDSLVNQLKLNGMAKMLAQNCEIKNYSTGNLELCLLAEHKHLLEKKYQDKVKAALNEHFGNNIYLKFYF